MRPVCSQVLQSNKGLQRNKALPRGSCQVCDMHLHETCRRTALTIIDKLAGWVIRKYSWIRRHILFSATNWTLDATTRAGVLFMLNWSPPLGVRLTISATASKAHVYRLALADGSPICLRYSRHGCCAGVNFDGPVTIG